MPITIRPLLTGPFTLKSTMSPSALITTVTSDEATRSVTQTERQAERERASPYAIGNPRAIETTTVTSESPIVRRRESR